jgi:hypothetical protein
LGYLYLNKFSNQHNISKPMAKNKEENERPDQKELNVSKDASVDFPVEVIATEADPYHVTGTKFHAGSKKAEELVRRGWVKMAMIALLIMASFGFQEVKAQTSVLQSLYNATNTYTLARLQAATATRDTATNAGVAELYSKRISGPGTITIQVEQTKVSGTVAGTMTLYGSVDGVYYTAINTEETQTAIATKTLVDATGVTTYHWRLKTSPFLYYKIGVAGGTTCVYYLDGFILKH